MSNANISADEIKKVLTFIDYRCPYEIGLNCSPGDKCDDTRCIDCWGSALGIEDSILSWTIKEEE